MEEEVYNTIEELKCEVIELKKAIEVLEHNFNVTWESDKEFKEELENEFEDLEDKIKKLEERVEELEEQNEEFMEEWG